MIASLQAQILSLQGFKPAPLPVEMGLGPLCQALPQGAFPVGAVHELVAARPEDMAASCGFMAALLTTLMGAAGTLLWVTRKGMVFPPALQEFGLPPDRCVFVNVKNEREMMWAMEEALKCGALTAVVGELRALDFTASRRLQLAVEQSNVTGFVLRPAALPLPVTACVARWRISPLPSEVMDDLPGVGFTTWKVELLRIRNGKPGTWVLQWMDGRFVPVITPAVPLWTHQKAG